MKDTRLKEKSSHGDSLFPFQLYRHFNKDGNYSVNSHWHNEFEIIYVEKGEFKILKDSHLINIKAGELLFINSGEIHSIEDISNSESIHHAIVFHPNFINTSNLDYCHINILEPLIKQSIKLPSTINSDSIQNSKIINEIIDIIDRYTSRTPGYQLTIKGSLYKILSYLVENNSFIASNTIEKNLDYKLQLLKKSVTYIHQNYQQKIYIKDLAHEVNMNSQYFCRFFKSMTGKTPVDFINTHRIEEATLLLSSTDLNITDISLKVGIDNFSYFNKLFRHYKNCTPSEYRKNNSIPIKR